MAGTTSPEKASGVLRSAPKIEIAEACSALHHTGGDRLQTQFASIPKQPIPLAVVSGRPE
jgi:hypothetical protein